MFWIEKKKNLNSNLNLLNFANRVSLTTKVTE